MAHGTLRRLGTGAALAAAALVLGPIVSEAILVSPHAVFISAATRTAQVFLINTGTNAEEVAVELKFGYPVTDSAGRISVQLFDTIPAGEPAATAWIRAFPRRVVVQPGERQVVRLLAQPPAGLADGEYWTRMIVTARGAQLQVPTADTAVQAGVSLVVSTIISVTYRTGQVQTGIDLSDFRAELGGDSLVAWVGLQRQGNAAWLGTTWVRVKDATGQVVRQWDTPTAVYHSLRRRFAWPLEGLAPGRYTVELDLNTARDDIPRRDVLPAAPIVRSVGVDVP